ncbi:lysophospholipid acyltransferase family protein [Sulfurimonas sp.]|uniref:lysophospholipid acyltransferase family protein n=1 Tax=Sulfurimonas sp. TaxID=2022749 RepID=UPI002B49B100|nr:lysophospholipid acyltransferase family protein [Sulfurimonas sp.]
MLKQIFFLFIVRPLIILISGINLRNREKLPQDGPCIIVANHNSHLDTMILMSIFSLSKIKKVRPLAAADYFLRNRYLAWFSLNVLGIIPLSRKPKKSEGHPFAKVHEVLSNGDIVILFPEGSRGEAEKMVPFKTGIAHLAKSCPNVPIVSVYIHGAGKSLPKGEALFVPFIIDVNIADAIYYKNDNIKDFTIKIEETIKKLQSEIL